MGEEKEEEKKENRRKATTELDDCLKRRAWGEGGGYSIAPWMSEKEKSEILGGRVVRARETEICLAGKRVGGG